MNPWAVLTSAVLVALAAPYSARLTLSVPDRDRREWWRYKQRVTPTLTRVAVCALLGAALGALAGAAEGWTPVLPAGIALALLTTPLAVIDIEHHRLPNRLVFTADVLLVITLTTAAACSGWPSGLRALEASAVVFVVFYMLCYLAPGSFGYGDTKLLAPLAAFLGWFGWLQVYYGIAAGFVIGAFSGLAAIGFGRATRKTRIPFGPSLILGTFIVAALHRW